MSEIRPEVEKASSKSRAIRGTMLGSLAISAPAAYAAFALSVGMSPSSVTWIALGVLLVLALAIGVSADRVIGHPSQADTSRDPLSGAERRLAGVSFIGRGAAQLCYWLAPPIWLSCPTSFLAFLSVEIFPGLTKAGEMGVALAAALILALGLSYLPASPAKFVVLLSGLIQIGAVIVFATIYVHNKHAAQAPKSYTMDSTGQPTTYVQDTVPDPSRTNQDPSATLPKVDANGNPVWVYDAVDSNGNAMHDAAGNPIVVPTDAQGRLTALPPGCAKAVPEEFSIPNASVSVSSTITYRGSIVLSRSAADVWLEAFWPVAVASLCIFQLLSSLGRRVKHARLLVAALIILVCVQGGCAVALALNDPNLFEVMPSTVPIGDVMQLVGAWAFGSAGAGWWLMFTEGVVLELVLLAAAWTSLRTSTDAFEHIFPLMRRESQPRARSHRHLLVRSAVTATLCTVGFWQLMSQYLLQGGPPSIQIVSFFPLRWAPGLLSVLWLAVSLCVMIVCTTTGLLAFFRAKGPAGEARFTQTVAPALGLALGIIGLLFCLAGFVVLHERRTEECLAALLCAGWGIGSYLLQRRTFRSAERSRLGLCISCGYDLRGTPDRCPECGAAAHRLPMGVIHDTAAL